MNTTAKPSELLPCKCGSPAQFSDEFQDCDGNPAVECTSCNMLSWTPDDWNRRPPSSEQAGDWVLVPINPTAEMLEAGNKELLHNRRTQSELHGCQHIYQAFLQAAPSQHTTGALELPFSPYLVSEWTGPEMIDRKTWTAYTADQLRAYGEACRAAPAKPCDAGVADVLDEMDRFFEMEDDPPYEVVGGWSDRIRRLTQPQRQGRAVSSSGWGQDQMVEILADAPRNSLLNELIHNVAYAGCDPILQLRDSAMALFDLIAPAFYTEQPASAAVADTEVNDGR